MRSFRVSERLRLMHESAHQPDSRRTIVAPPNSPLVLCGAGPLGQMTLAHLRQIGVEPLAVIDNDPRRWGTRLDGISIIDPASAAAIHGREACFVVTIYNGRAVRRQLAQLGCVHVAHFAELFLSHPDEFLPFCGLVRRQVVLDQWSDACRAAGIWSDERSVEEYLAQLEWRLSPGDRSMPPHDAAADTYFPSDLFRYLDEEVLFDCGAFDGDSIRQYLRRRPLEDGSHIVAFEPDAGTFEKLTAFRRSLPPDTGARIRLEPWAVADRSGQVRFSALGSVRSGVGEEGSFEAHAVALDDLELVPTYIKMDVEGFELPALRGSAEILRRHTPLLAISLYHHASDLWTIPNFIKSLVPDYHLFLRRYAEDCWESIMYAVPTGRLLEVNV